MCGNICLFTVDFPVCDMIWWRFNCSNLIWLLWDGRPVISWLVSALVCFPSVRLRGSRASAGREQAGLWDWSHHLQATRREGGFNSKVLHRLITAPHLQVLPVSRKRLMGLLPLSSRAGGLDTQICESNNLRKRWHNILKLIPLVELPGRWGVVLAATSILQIWII